MISEETLEDLKCAISDEEHFVTEPITLPNCGHSICKKCIPKDDLKQFRCKLCGLVSKQDLTEFEVSKGTHKLLKIYLEDIFNTIEIETGFKLNEIKGIYKKFFFLV